MAVEFVALKLAESVVSQTVERLAELLINEASSLRGVQGDIQNLQIELRWIESFLRDADKKQEKDERVRLWIKEVRDVSCHIEDIVETYVSKVRFSYIKVVHLRKLRAQVTAINEKLRSIGERRQRYQIELPSRDNRDSNSLRYQRRSYPDEDEDDIITLKSTVSAFKEDLMRNDDRRCVVSIVGMGGLGKTTLAKRVFNDADVKNNFGCSAWVFVSQQWVAREILTEILMQIGFSSKNQPQKDLKGANKYTKEFVEERRSEREILNALEDYELVALLKSKLNEKKYLIVLDDVWNVDVWNSIENAFPKRNPGSKVVLTTRNRDVATSANPDTVPIEPQLLTETESLELLKLKAFPSEIFGGGRFPLEFEEIGKELVAECGGLPLAIVVLGGLLRTKNSLEKWEKVKKDVKLRTINKLKSNRQYLVEDILELSFQDLPYYLKPCFLYLGSFPEDSEIPKSLLIRLWIAEGFVRTMNEAEKTRSSIKEVGLKYLEELIDRCMVQIDKANCTRDRSIKSVRLHDLMRDLCVSKAKEELFLEIGTSSMDGSSSSLQYNQSRRISVHGDHNFSPQPHLRSLLCFSIQNLPNLHLVSLLRVLKLDFSSFELKLPRGIGNLIHLKYMRISCRRNGEFSLPHSLGNLRNLQTLDLNRIDSGKVMLPSSVWKLTQLRHLSLPPRYRLPLWAFRRFFGGQTQTKIETLKWIKAKDLMIKCTSLPRMPNIEVLGVTALKVREVTVVLESLESRSHLQNLRSLTMWLSKSRENGFPNFQLLSCCEALSRLCLQGRVSDKNFAFLPKSLTELNLFFDNFNQPKITILEKLPSLRVLVLYDDDLKWDGPKREDNKKWVFSSGGFPQLESLLLAHIDIVEEWEVEEGSLCSLRNLDIRWMLDLKAIPEGLRYVTTLRAINFISMKKEFEDRLRSMKRDGSEGEDFYKVQHVPSITIKRSYTD